MSVAILMTPIMCTCDDCSYQGWLAGAQLSFDPSKSKLTKTNFAVGYEAPEFILHTNVYVCAIAQPPRS